MVRGIVLTVLSTLANIVVVTVAIMAAFRVRRHEPVPDWMMWLVAGILGVRCLFGLLAVPSGGGLLMPLFEGGTAVVWLLAARRLRRRDDDDG